MKKNSDGQISVFIILLALAIWRVDKSHIVPWFYHSLAPVMGTLLMLSLQQQIVEERRLQFLFLETNFKIWVG